MEINEGATLKVRELAAAADRGDPQEIEQMAAKYKLIASQSGKSENSENHLCKNIFLYFHLETTRKNLILMFEMGNIVCQVLDKEN